MNIIYGKPEPPVKFLEKLKHLFIAHWKGILCVSVPTIFSFLIVGDAPSYSWCGYCLIIMGIFWMTECLPLPITALLPVVIFPLGGVMSTFDTCNCYVNDTVLMFNGSLMLAYSVEQSGLHKRLAFCTIRLIGYSHLKLLLAICIVTTFVSMWITNTAATTLMVPVVFACLRVFDKQRLMTMYNYDPDGEKYASDITLAYFCCVAFSASIGGTGTLIGTGTNLVFKGLFEVEFPNAPELLSFPKFSAFGVPYMMTLETFLYLSTSINYLGFLRPKSKAAKDAKMSDKAIAQAKYAIDQETKKLGPLTYWEVMVLLLFGGAMVGFFCRSPQIFSGWADLITDFFSHSRTSKYIRDSALSMFVAFLMFLLPSSLVFFKNFTGKNQSDLPSKPVTSVLDWGVLNNMLPYSVSFLLGGGFAVSTAASATGLNIKIAEALDFMSNLPLVVAIFLFTTIVVLVSNFALNIAVCTVFVPITMNIAKKMNINPLYACITSGFSASMCFMLPVGTPPNLIVQGAASIKTMAMVKCGFMPSMQSILITWFFVCFFAPIVWSELKHPAPESWK